MELDDLKKEWQDLNSHASNKNILTPIIINQMTQKNYNSKINKIKYPEFVGTLVCFASILFISFNFNELDTLLFQVIGLLTIVILIIIPVFSFLSITKFNSSEDFNKPYIEMIRQFVNNKLQFHQYQKMNAMFCYLLVVGIIILLPKFFYDKDITSNKTFWTFAFAFGYIFLIVFSKWVKSFYSNSLNQAEQLIKEINETVR